VIDTSTLNATWPGKCKETTRRTSENDQDESKPTVAISETDLKLRKEVDAAFSTSMEQLPKVLQIVKNKPDFWSILLTHVYSTPSLITSSSTTSSLLHTAFKNQDTMDLSPFDLNEDQIREIDGKTRERKNLYTLSLSGNQNLHEDLLRDILSCHTSSRAEIKSWLRSSEFNDE
jgi:hypothetical protein